MAETYKVKDVDYVLGLKFCRNGATFYREFLLADLPV